MLRVQRVSAMLCLGIGLLGIHMAAAQDSAVSQSPQPVAVSAPVPRLVRFSGVVKEENGNPRTGATGITFALYQDQAGGAALWQETQNVALDAQGRYTVLLGASSAEGMSAEVFSSNQARWLGIQPEGQAEQRVLLVSVPYALKAADAETLGGMPASSFVLAAPPAAGTTSSTGQTGTSTNATSATVPTPSLTGTGAPNTLAEFDSTETNLVSSSITDTGKAVSTMESVGIGTATPNAALDVEFSTGAPTNAMLSNITYNNTTAVSGAVVSAFDMNFMDASTATNLSKQTARIALIRQPGATGTVTAFDSALTATEFLHASAPYPIRGINIEGPTMDSGTSLSYFTGLYIGSPGGAGTVVNNYALLTEPNAGFVGIGTTSPGAQLEVAGSLTVDSPGVITGNGSGLTGLNAGSLTSGMVPSSALTGVNGSGLTNLNAANLTGTIPTATLQSSNVALVNAANMFTASQAISAAPGGTGAALGVAASGTTGVNGLVASTNDPSGLGALFTNTGSVNSPGRAYILEAVDSTGNYGFRVNANGLESTVPLAQRISNDSTGTTLNTLVRYTNSGTVATIPTTGGFAQTGAIGVVVADPGGSGTKSTVALTGFASCLFDNTTPTIVGDYVVPSTTVVSSTATAGYCHDYGQNSATLLPIYPLPGVQIVGRVTSSNNGVGTCTSGGECQGVAAQVYLYGFETRAIGQASSFSLTGLTGAVSETLLTPLVAELFRVNVYMTATGGTTCPSPPCIGLTINWQDENGAQSDTLTGGIIGVNQKNSGSFVIHSVGEQPITFSTTYTTGTNLTYEVFVTMERLQ